MSFKRVIQLIGHPIVRLFFRIQVIGKENFLQDRAFVFCANHTSNLDVVVSYLSVNRPLNFMAKEELFHFKPFGWLLTKLGAFPVKRDSNDMSAFKKAFQVLKKGEVLAMFPQGTRSDVIDVEAAKAGAVLIANKTNVPIVPAAITGGYKIWSKVTIRIGTPYYFDQPPKRLDSNEIKEISNEIVGRIKTLSEEKDES